MTAPKRDLNVLFPLPSPPPSALSPTPLAGITRESAEALVRLLKENHQRFHCFFNDRHFHNHLSHHLLAAYFLGATPSLLQAVFDYHAKYQRPAYPSPAAIDNKNWKDHLGDEDYYDSYLAFFSFELVNNGLEPTIQKYIFSTDANWGNTEKDKHPEMLSRLLAGLLHPYIFLGHGVEFGQLGMVAEGIAQAAVHSVPTSKLLSREFLAPRSSVPFATALASKLSLTSTPVNSAGTHPLNILARVLKDPRLAPEKPADSVILDYYFQNTIETRGEVIRQYADTWDADASSPEAVAQRLEEMAWVATLIYGIGGFSKKDQSFKADFFMMHLVTSSLFLPSMLAHLSADSKRTFLRSYFAVLLGYWVSQGRTGLNIQNFYANTKANPVPPGPQPTPNPATLDKGNINPNPWYPLLQSTLVHPGEHLLKLERALGHYASLYGTTASRHFNNTELEGAEILDGTVFLRAAWLSLERNGWMREGKEEGGWDFDGFFQG